MIALSIIANMFISNSFGKDAGEVAMWVMTIINIYFILK